MELPAESFLAQLSGLSNLASEIPEDASTVEKNRVGSLLMSAVPLEGMGLQAYFSSDAGKAGLQALKNLISEGKTKAQDVLSDIQDRAQGALENVQQRAQGLQEQAQGALDQAQARLQGRQLNTEEPEQDGEEMQDVTNFESQQAPTQAADSEAPIAETEEAIGEGAGEAIGAETAAETGALVAGSVLDAAGPIGAIAGLAITIGIGLHDLLAKPHEAPPIYGAYQFGV